MDICIQTKKVNDLYIYIVNYLHHYQSKYKIQQPPQSKLHSPTERAKTLNWHSSEASGRLHNLTSHTYFRGGGPRTRIRANIFGRYLRPHYAPRTAPVNRRRGIGLLKILLCAGILGFTGFFVVIVYFLGVVRCVFFIWNLWNCDGWSAGTGGFRAKGGLVRNSHFRLWKIILENSLKVI